MCPRKPPSPSALTLRYDRGDSFRGDMKFAWNIACVVLLLFTGCSKPREDDRITQEEEQTVNTEINPSELTQMISGLRAYTGSTKIILKGSLISGLVILSTNEIKRGSDYSYRIRFLYPMESSVIRRIEADVPFSTMQQAQWFDKVFIRSIE